MRLVRNTGDRLVILDRESDETMVMMNLEEYENLLGSDDYDYEDSCDDDCDGSCDCCGDKNNLPTEFENNADEWDEEWNEKAPVSPSVKDLPLSDEELMPTEDFEHVEPVISDSVASAPLAQVPISKTPGRVGGMSSLASILQEEPLGDVPHEDDEEPFLLEPVE